MTADRWWRRNRVGLVVLPVALAAAVAASSNRVEERWWLAEARDLTEADQGSWAELEANQYDRTGDVPFEVRVRLDDIGQADQPFGDGEVNVPDGAMAVAVHLTLAADPDTPLTGCTLLLRGDDGTTYGYQSSTPSVSQPPSPCVPPDTPGPDWTWSRSLTRSRRHRDRRNGRSARWSSSRRASTSPARCSPGVRPTAFC